jgi:hypothetical protein
VIDDRRLHVAAAEEYVLKREPVGILSDRDVGTPATAERPASTATTTATTAALRGGTGGTTATAATSSGTGSRGTSSGSRASARTTRISATTSGTGLASGRRSCGVNPATGKIGARLCACN